MDSDDFDMIFLESSENTDFCIFFPVCEGEGCGDPGPIRTQVKGMSMYE